MSDLKERIEELNKREVNSKDRRGVEKLVKDAGAIIQELTEQNTKLVEALKDFMQVGDQCSRGYISKCFQKAQAILKELNKD